jgi:hypothetical protein
MVVIAFDPGETTGFAKANVDFDGRGTPVFTLLEASEVKTYGQFHDIVLHQLDSTTMVLVERFNLFPGKASSQIGSTFPSAEWIGVIKYVMWLLVHDKLAFQTPAQKERINDDMLRAMFGIDKLNPSPHIRDAMRHIVFWGLDQRYG